ncbi:thioredoxin [Fontibacillus phaseoli]|uniref:Thioredoxin n=1 Tax=Fontibacillus phaseoli TaxID=1416533 RepID=A0A369BA35_9BACL|nr:thioredoxin family protein [Fontibacillus phaseoli]RCX18175.1 thioredoxin [Fontibacillus phaseoli]
MLQEITERELLHRLDASEGKEALFFHTPLCGTCRLAERMLEIVEDTGAPVPVLKMNINFTPVLRDKWQIASVPCLIVLENGIPIRKEYALRSVVDLHRWLTR